MTACRHLKFSAADIESEYRRLGHKLGWRFLTCPEGNIDTASVALITINPGGGSFEASKWSVEQGSAYEIESWKSCAQGQEALQRQVLRMFEVMGVSAREVLSGYLVPFRSPGWEALPRREESIPFGVGLWRSVLERAQLRTVLAFGKETAPHLTTLLNARIGSKYATDWGDQTIDEHQFGPDGRLIVMPHLSRFRLFGRPLSEAAFLAAIGRAGEAPTMPGTSLESKKKPSPKVRSAPITASDVIRVLVEVNPKRGKSRLRFDCYRDGMTTVEYEETVRQSLGSAEAAKCRDDLRWDADPRRGFIRIGEG